jgi:hypothetical protein
LTLRTRCFAAKPQQTLNFYDVPTGDDSAVKISGSEQSVDGRPADAGVLRGELDSDAKTLLERDVADFLPGGLGAHFLPPRKA